MDEPSRLFALFARNPVQDAATPGAQSIVAVITLTPAPPFRLDLTVWVLRRLPINQMDRWDGKTYRRVLLLGDTPVEVAAVQAGSARAPKLMITTHGARLSVRMREAMISMLDKMLGLSVDLHPFHRLAEGDQRLARLIDPFIGFKPPRLPSVFETLVNGIACQQLSLQVGMHLLNRLCRAYGKAAGENHAFPCPADLASASPAQLKRLGFSGNKSLVILTAARAVAEGTLNLEELAALETAEALDRLIALKGIGRWTAQYILLRGLGRLDVFPADDVGGQNKMQRWLRRKRRPDYEKMHRILAPWRPYRGLLYFYLLLNHQALQGLFEPTPKRVSHEDFDQTADS
jgi:DNA-3-methyladenine glycosylase II